MYWQACSLLLEYWLYTMPSDKCLTPPKSLRWRYKRIGKTTQQGLSYSEVCISLSLSVALLLGAYQSLALLSLQYQRWRSFVLQILHGQQAIGYLRYALGQSQVASCVPLSKILKRPNPELRELGGKLFITQLRVPRYVKSHHSQKLMLSVAGHMHAGDVLLISDCEHGETATIARVMPHTGAIKLTQPLQHHYAAQSLVAVIHSGQWFIRKPKSGLPNLAYKPEQGATVDVVPGIDSLRVQHIGGCWLIALQALAQNRPPMHWQQRICEQ